MANERLVISLTFLRSPLLLSLSVFCGTIDEACTVGKTLTPSSSFLSVGLKFAPGSPEKYLLKSNGLKGSEHTAECFVGFQCARFALIKSTHFLRLLRTSTRSSPKNGITRRAIPFSRLETLLQLKATQVVGILLHLVQATLLKTSPKSEMNLLV